MSNVVKSSAAAVTAAVSSTAADPIRAALNEIVSWSADAPAWQRDALRRLYGQLKLAPTDLEELYVLCRQAHDLLEGEEISLTAEPLAASHVPANWNTGGVVALKSIGQAKNVNALADDQTLYFAEAGLTIVYGDNGAGKSGYGRVLKRVCRARDQEEILTNAYATPGGKPSAQIKYSVTSAVQPEVAWQDGVAANLNLSNISVFDSKCASIHVDGKNELAYTPVPLQLLQALADLAREISNKLKAKKIALEGQVPSFRKKPASREGTAVHQIIVSLSAATQPAAINSLAQMSEHETARLEQLKRDLASDPVKEVKKLKAQKQRIEELTKLVTASEYVLLPARADELRQLLIIAKDNATAAQLAASEAFNKEPLPQAGSEVWKTLWEAARAFSTQEAYPALPFPNTGDDAACVLCQQPLSTDAATRLLVTNTIRDAFASETTALSIADRRLELTQEASGYGSTKFKVSLIRNPKAKVEKVLSEGEHRCVALAAFLAELSTAHNRSGVIFDDPVSSLDHNYRELVAARLVKEAVSGRQVIVFTHDIPFLMMLDEEARNKSLNPNYQCVNRADDRAGICVQGAPSKAQPVPEIVSKVEKRLATTRVLHASGRQDEWSDQVKAMAGLMRDGWERASEFAVSPVVRRFNNAVHTGGLRKVTVLTDADCDDLKEGYGFCCTHCHTDPPGVNRPMPTPDKMNDEITRLRNWFDSVRTRQEQKK
jgi:energy-coupling factor transporter ATP-binding protein EcfA2